MAGTSAAYTLVRLKRDEPALAERIIRIRREKVVAKLQRSTRWDGLDPEYALLGGILQQACKDALQTDKPALRVEATQFLQICAPTVANRLLAQRQTNVAITDSGSRNMATMQWLGESQGVQFYRVDGAMAYPQPMVETRRLIDNGARWQITRFIELSQADIEDIGELLLEPDKHIQVLRTLESYPSVMGYVGVGSPELEDANRAIPIAARTRRVVEKARRASAVQ